MNSVYGTYNAVHTGRKDGRVHGTRPITGRVHGRDRVTDGPCTWPVHGPSTQSVHGRERPCTRAVNKAVYRVPDRVGVPVHGRGRTMYTALARRCTRSVHAVNGRVQGTYNVVHTGRKDGRVHGTRPCTRRVHGRDRVTDRPCTWPVHGRVHSLYTAVGGRVHGRVQSTRPCRCTLYTAVDALCTRPLHAGVFGPYTP